MVIKSRRPADADQKGRMLEIARKIQKEEGMFMAIAPCNTTTDDTQRELVAHGTLFFPIACYDDDLYEQGVMWHWHEELEYAIAQGGNCVFQVENHTVTLRPGDAIFINAQVLHAVDPAEVPETGLHSTVFHPRLVGGSQNSAFWEELIQPLLEDSAMRYTVLTPEVPWQGNVISHLHTAWNAMAQEPEDHKNLIRYHLSAALHLLVKNSPVVKKPLSQQEQVDAARVRGMLEYIHGNYAYDLTMKEIAQHINCSNSVCLRCFHQLLGTTPIQYLKNYRLEKAAQLLRTTTKTAKEIALECGFNDISYFTRSFREKMGCTPGEYRRNTNAGTV